MSAQTAQLIQALKLFTNILVRRSSHGLKPGAMGFSPAEPFSIELYTRKFLMVWDWNLLPYTADHIEAALPSGLKKEPWNQRFALGPSINRW